MTTYPLAPWPLHGSMWVTLFRVAEARDGRRPGLYAAALVDYQEPSPLTYHELLVARALPPRTPRLTSTITDIWVDSAASRAGGRELWAIPKEICTAEQEQVGSQTRWRVEVGGAPVAAARFTRMRLPLPSPRLPLRLRADQPPIDDRPQGCVVTAGGHARVTPCRGRWQIDPDGPIAFLTGARQLASLHLETFDLTFG